MVRYLALPLMLVAALVLSGVQGQEKGKEKETDKGKETDKAKATDNAKTTDKTKTTDKGKSTDKGKTTDKDAPVLLKWKFEKGSTFYQSMTTKTKQTMKVQQNPEVVQSQDQTFYFSWTPQEQKGDDWIIKQKIDGVKMNIDIGSQKLSVDTTVPEDKTKPNNPLSDFVKALVGHEFTITLNTKDMKVTAIEGQKEFLDKLTKVNPQMKPLLEQILSEEALRQMAEPTFAAVPGKEVSPTKDNTWKRETSLNMGPIGKYENTYTYTYDGKDDKGLVKIKVDTTLKYVEPGETAGGPTLPFKIKSANLTAKKATGTILFNPDKGRVEKTSMSLDLEGSLSIEIGGQTTKVDLTQNQSSEVETFDTNPLEKKE